MTAERRFQAFVKFRRMPGAFWRPALAAACAMGLGTLAQASDPMVSVSAHQLIFAAQVQGTASPAQVVVIATVGTADVAIKSITIGGANSSDFTQTNTCPIAPSRMLAAGATCEIRVIFQPKTSGALSATLSIDDNASGSPQTVSLTGTASAPAPAVSLSPASLAFDSQPVGTPSVIRVAILTNSGSAIMNINSAIRIEGTSKSEFLLEKIENACPNDSGQLAPRASCRIGLIFKPISIGTKSAEVIIESDAPGSPHSIALSGAGIATRTMM